MDDGFFLLPKGPITHPAEMMLLQGEEQFLDAFGCCQGTFLYLKVLRYITQESERHHLFFIGQFLRGAYNASPMHPTWKLLNTETLYVRDPLIIC